MAIALCMLGLSLLLFIATLIVDGLRSMATRRRLAAARRPMTLVLAERHEVADQLLCLKLVAPNGKALPACRAGQHLLLHVPAGHNGRLVQRAYSLAAWHGTLQAYELGIRREALGQVSPWLWDRLQPGDTVQVSRPQGHFTVHPGAAALVLIGGGIGITPMRAMLHEALASDRRVTLFHAARSEALLLYRKEFEALAARHAGFHYVPVLSRPATSWPGLTGRLRAQQIVKLTDPSAGSHYYMCAGNEMMEKLRTDLRALGIGEDHIHGEAFGVGAGSALAGLSISVNGSGIDRTIRSHGEPTLMATLEHDGIALPSECRAGNCGQCLVSLDAGKVDWLLKPEFKVPAGKILPCVCAARTDLAITV